MKMLNVIIKRILVLYFIVELYFFKNHQTILAGTRRMAYIA